MVVTVIPMLISMSVLSQNDATTTTTTTDNYNDNRYNNIIIIITTNPIITIEWLVV